MSSVPRKVTPPPAPHSRPSCLKPHDQASVGVRPTRLFRCLKSLLARGGRRVPDAFTNVTLRRRVHPPSRLLPTGMLTYQQQCRAAAGARGRGNT